MIARFGDACARFAQRVVPHPFVFAIALSALVLVAGWSSWPDESARPAIHGVLSAWYDGLWSKPLLAFGFQMALVLLTGFAVADAPPVRRVLTRVAGVWSSPAQAVALASASAFALNWVHWGLGIVGGGILAREIGRSARRRGLPLPYPLVVGAAYAGNLVWHGGLSGSAPLIVAQADHAQADLVGALPLSQTVFAPQNLLLAAALTAVIPLLMARMARGARPTDAALLPGDAPRGAEPGERAGAEREAGPAARWGRSPWTALLALLPAAAAVLFVVLPGVAGGGRPFDLNTVLFLFLFAGLALHRSPSALAASFSRGAGETAGILLQFPFYFGVMGVMRESGLVETLANTGVAASLSLGELGLPSRWCFETLTFLTAGVVNLSVPSGGGQWAVQGEIVLRAALDSRIGLEPGRAVMALAYGDAWTNMIQPFWALALLSITGVRARDIMGYTIAAMALAAPLYLLAFAL